MYALSRMIYSTPCCILYWFSNHSTLFNQTQPACFSHQLSCFRSVFIFYHIFISFLSCLLSFALLSGLLLLSRSCLLCLFLTCHKTQKGVHEKFEPFYFVQLNTTCLLLISTFLFRFVASVSFSPPLLVSNVPSNPKRFVLVSCSHRCCLGLTCHQTQKDFLYYSCLYKFCSPAVAFEMMVEMTQAYHRFKEDLTTARLLFQPDPSKPFKLM